MNQRELWEIETEKSIKAAKEQGVNFTEPNLKAFIDSVKPMHERVSKEYPEFMEHVNRLSAEKQVE